MLRFRIIALYAFIEVALKKNNNYTYTIFSEATYDIKKTKALHFKEVTLQKKTNPLCYITVNY
jgi:hypothetical protein